MNNRRAEAGASPEKMGDFAAKVSFFPRLSAPQIPFLKSHLCFRWIYVSGWCFSLQHFLILFFFSPINPQKIQGMIPLWQFPTNSLENNVVHNVILVGKSILGISAQRFSGRGWPWTRVQVNLDFCGSARMKSMIHESGREPMKDRISLGITSVKIVSFFGRNIMHLFNWSITMPIYWTPAVFTWSLWSSQQLQFTTSVLGEEAKAQVRSLRPGDVK